MKRDDAREYANIFVERLLAKLETGQVLGDPRVSGVIAAWASICDGIPDKLLMSLVPGTIRLLFRKNSVAEKLYHAGLRENVLLQHEAIPPFVIAFRRLQTMRSVIMPRTEALMAETRQELRELNRRFYDALDQAVALQDENQRLKTELIETQAREEAAREEARASKRDAALAYNLLEDTRAKTLTKLKLALEALRDALEKRLNDPDSTLVSSASLSVQSYYMVLEDLGCGEEALKLSSRILGERMGQMM